MEGRNYIPPSALKLRQNLQPLINSSTPPHYAIGDRTGRPMQSLLIGNQRLVSLNVSLKQELSAAQNELRHLSSVADKVKAKRDVQVRELHERAVNLEAEVRSIDKSSAALAKVLRDLQKLRSEKKEVDEKLNKLRGDVAKLSLEWHEVKEEIEAMQKENQRGREAIEQEKKVHARNTEERLAMENYRMFMVGEIQKLQVEVVDADKRARAAAAAEAASIRPGSWDD